MESVPFLQTTAFSPPLTHSSRPKPQFLRPLRRLPLSFRLPAPAALKGPRGFGPASQKTRKRREPKRRDSEDDEDDEGGEEGEEEEEEGTIPEVVTNRMMRRMGLSVGIPLSVGLLFFPFFYYLKVVAKVDVPSWVPVIVSFFFFGSALIGVSYGIVSASWDPLREGSLLGWNEARRNWPVFWQSLWGGGRK